MTIRLLIIVSGLGLTEMVNVLLAHGASIEDKAQDECTALMNAAMNGFSETTLALLEAGANPDVTTNDGNTILTLAQDELETEALALLESAIEKRRLLETLEPDSNKLHAPWLTF